MIITIKKGVHVYDYEIWHRKLDVVTLYKRCKTVKADSFDQNLDSYVIDKGKGFVYIDDIAGVTI